MIFIFTVIIWCSIYAVILNKKFNSQDAQDRPWMYGRNEYIGATLKFIIHLVLSIIVGATLQKLS